MKKETSLITDDMGHCIVCGSPYVETHHVFEGWANRKIADKYNLVIPLCRVHHDEIHNNKLMMDYYRAVGQRVYEQKIGNRNQFYADFGKYFTEE